MDQRPAQRIPNDPAPIRRQERAQRNGQNQKRRRQRRTISSLNLVHPSSHLDYVLQYQDLEDKRFYQRAPSNKHYPVRLVPFVPVSVRLRHPRHLSPIFTITQESATLYLDTPMPLVVCRDVLQRYFNEYLDDIRTVCVDSQMKTKLIEFVAVKLLNLSIHVFYNAFHNNTREWWFEDFQATRISNWLEMDWTWRQEFMEVPRIPFNFN